MATKILHTKDPGMQKKLGRQVQNFDAEVWNEKCRDIVKKGNIAKVKLVFISVKRHHHHYHFLNMVINIVDRTITISIVTLTSCTITILIIVVCSSIGLL